MLEMLISDRSGAFLCRTISLHMLIALHPLPLSLSLLPLHAWSHVLPGVAWDLIRLP